MSEARFTSDEIARVTRASHRRGSTTGVSRSQEAQARCAGVSTDSRTLTEGELFVALEGPSFDGHAFLTEALEKGAFGAVVRRGSLRIADVVGLFHLFEVDDTLVALGKLARHHRDRFPHLEVAAITGSNGKTTTKELLSAALAPLGPGLKTAGNLNNRIGVPLTLFGLRGEHQWAVIEMGMNEPGEIAALTRITRPDLGLVTIASEVHLSGLGSVDAVAAAKAELYHGLADGTVAVVNLDDPRLSLLAQDAGAIEAGGRLRRVTYGAHPAADVRLGDVSLARDGTLRLQVLFSPALLELFGLPRSVGERIGSGHLIIEVEVPLVGRHNAHNACGALAAAVALGVRPTEAAEALSDLPRLARRLEPRAGPKGSLILDDSYNAGPAAAKAAIETAADLAGLRGGRAIAVLGDMLELGDREQALHEEVGRAAASARLALLVAVGPLSMHTANAAEQAGLSEVVREDDAERVIEIVTAAIGAGDVVLVKGSRGARLERVADPLVAMAAEEAAK